MRLVATGIPPRNDQKLHYSLVCRQRGRYDIGPRPIYQTDPFGLARTRVEAPARSELIVYPAVEDTRRPGSCPRAPGSGEAAARRLYRSAAEFYTMREYVTGDDLRRIHWPSVARTGRLMIRQDESTRRSSAMLLLDTRQSALGAQGSPGFESGRVGGRLAGAGALAAGFALRMGTVDAAPGACPRTSCSRCSPASARRGRRRWWDRWPTSGPRRPRRHDARARLRAAAGRRGGRALSHRRRVRPQDRGPRLSREPVRPRRRPRPSSRGGRRRPAHRCSGRGGTSFSCIRKGGWRTYGGGSEARKLQAAGSSS